jgi:hypothetical protein
VQCHRCHKGLSRSCGPGFELPFFCGVLVLQAEAIFVASPARPVGLGGIVGWVVGWAVLVWVDGDRKALLWRIGGQGGRRSSVPCTGTVKEIVSVCSSFCPSHAFAKGVMW